MPTLVRSTYMVVQADDANTLAREVDKATASGFKPQGGVAVCTRPHPLTDKPMMWYAQALVHEFWISDNGD